MKDTFIYLYGWDDSETTLYFTLISSSAILGCVIGSILGGLLIQRGRRKVILFLNLVSSIGCIIKCIETVPTVCIGRLIYGFACGSYSVAVPRIIDELVPTHLLS